MQEWTKIARASIKILLIVLFVGMLSACASSSDEPSQNGIADCSGSADCEPDHSDKDCMGCQIFTILLPEGLTEVVLMERGMQNQLLYTSSHF